jgi:CheY-like chemotaxis protein
VDTSAKPADRLLVIDDDAIMCELLSLVLGAEGYTVLTANSGEDALALLESLAPAQSPHVILSDLKMPGISHSALAARLRLACPRPTVLLAMSASEPAAGDTRGFDSFLLKPFNVYSYHAAVQKSRRRPRAASTLKPPSVAADPLVPALDEAIFAKLCTVMDAAQISQIYTMFLDDATARAGRMSDAAAVNDAVTFIREAHSVKGGCGMLGATELYSLAGRMETGGLECTSLLNDFRPAFDRLRRILDERKDQTVEGPSDLQP